jgi:hypothetical protein
MITKNLKTLILIGPKNGGAYRPFKVEKKDRRGWIIARSEIA